jgi:putative membrane protein
MNVLAAVLRFLLPWELSPVALAACALPAAAYVRGLRARRAQGRPEGALRALAFLAGVGSIYAVLQTHLDFLAQHMFWIHRVQHLVLHHLGPFLIALSAPTATLAAGTPRALARRLAAVVANRAVRGLYRTLQQPVIACTLFVGLIFFWLTPAVHFYAMLIKPIYLTMNWSMLLDGLLFWWLILGPERAGAPRLATRMAMLVAVAIPQAILGAYLTFRAAPLYDVYGLCGRAFAISPQLDQQLGGLNTWIPPGMMSALGLVVLASRWMRADERGRWRASAQLGRAG